MRAENLRIKTLISAVTGYLLMGFTTVANGHASIICHKSKTEIRHLPLGHWTELIWVSKIFPVGHYEI